MNEIRSIVVKEMIKGLTTMSLDDLNNGFIYDVLFKKLDIDAPTFLKRHHNSMIKFLQDNHCYNFISSEKLVRDMFSYTCRTILHNDLPYNFDFNKELEQSDIDFIISRIKVEK